MLFCCGADEFFILRGQVELANLSLSRADGLPAVCYHLVIAIGDFVQVEVFYDILEL